jgi:hypothetical protein
MFTCVTDREYKMYALIFQLFTNFTQTACYAIERSIIVHS